jgi:hypothetical protein
MLKAFVILLAIGFIFSCTKKEKKVDMGVQSETEFVDDSVQNEEESFSEDSEVSDSTSEGTEDEENDE